MSWKGDGKGKGGWGPYNGGNNDNGLSNLLMLQMMGNNGSGAAGSGTNNMLPLMAMGMMGRGSNNHLTQLATMQMLQGLNGAQTPPKEKPTEPSSVDSINVDMLTC